MFRLRISIVVILCVVAFAEYSAGATISVLKDGTGDFTVIQGALDAAADGDTVLIGPGEFLEETTFNPICCLYDLRAYGQIKSAGLTIVGAGVGQTIIGPSVFIKDNFQEWNPRGFTYEGVGEVHISNITIRNCMIGVWMRGTLFMENCELKDNETGIQWGTVGAGGWVKNSTFLGVQEVGVFPTSIYMTGVGSDILIQDCHFENARPVVRGLQNVSFANCEFSNRHSGIDIYENSFVDVRNCTMSNISIAGIALFNFGGTCEIWDSVISGGMRALQTSSGGRFLVENSVLIGGTTAVLYATQNPGPCVINNCDLVKGDGPVVLCDLTASPVTHDLTNNYWGTTDAVEIEQWIIDINDDPGVLATVQFDPFFTDPLPVEGQEKSFGSFKSMFR